MCGFRVWCTHYRTKWTYLVSRLSHVLVPLFPLSSPLAGSSLFQRRCAFWGSAGCHAFWKVSYCTSHLRNHRGGSAGNPIWFWAVLGVWDWSWYKMTSKGESDQKLDHCHHLEWLSGFLHINMHGFCILFMINCAFVCLHTIYIKTTDLDGRQRIRSRFFEASSTAWKPPVEIDMFKRRTFSWG